MEGQGESSSALWIPNRYYGPPLSFDFRMPGKLRRSGAVYLSVMVTYIEQDEPQRVSFLPIRFLSLLSSLDDTGSAPQQSASTIPEDDERSAYILPWQALKNHIFLPPGYMGEGRWVRSEGLTPMTKLGSAYGVPSNVLQPGQRVTLACVAPRDPVLLLPPLDDVPRILQVSKRLSRGRGAAATRVRATAANKGHQNHLPRYEPGIGFPAIDRILNSRSAPRYGIAAASTGITADPGDAQGNSDENETEVNAPPQAELEDLTAKMASIFLAEEDGLGFSLPVPVLVDDIFFMFIEPNGDSSPRLIADLHVRPCVEPIHPPLLHEAEDVPVEPKQGTGGRRGFFRWLFGKGETTEIKESRSDMVRRCKLKRVTVVEIKGTEALMSPKHLKMALLQIRSRLLTDTDCVISTVPRAPPRRGAARAGIRQQVTVQLVCPSVEEISIVIREKENADKAYKLFKRRRVAQLEATVSGAILGMLTTYAGFRGFTKDPQRTKEFFGDVIGEQHAEQSNPETFFPSENDLYHLMGVKNIPRIVAFRKKDRRIGNSGLAVNIGLSVMTLAVVATATLLGMKMARGSWHILRNRMRMSKLRKELERPLIGAHDSDAPRETGGEQECATKDVIFLQLLY
ncbi:hypothetical protein BESB_065050 [Besnoitia besnoiti]|uniref:Transmembrane protein n=1 Tax=Besnoitia besnoiti TaxID=94643 RepID=A0A2A9MB86_BESBE|nr:hypothetical protein BESB_065050 [Besnoitia besnoiti]PFH34474.1 hypothetical protein BESB_065050 [Besnoitia besnoiti]